MVKCQECILMGSVRIKDSNYEFYFHKRDSTIIVHKHGKNKITQSGFLYLKDSNKYFHRFSEIKKIGYLLAKANDYD